MTTRRQEGEPSCSSPLLISLLFFQFFLFPVWFKIMRIILFLILALFRLLICELGANESSDLGRETVSGIFSWISSWLRPFPQDLSSFPRAQPARLFFLEMMRKLFLIQQWSNLPILSPAKNRTKKKNKTRNMTSSIFSLVPLWYHFDSSS